MTSWYPAVTAVFNDKFQINTALEFDDDGKAKKKKVSQIKSYQQKFKTKSCFLPYLSLSSRLQVTKPMESLVK